MFALFFDTLLFNANIFLTFFLSRKSYNVVYSRFLTEDLENLLKWFHRVNDSFFYDKILRFSKPLPKN